MSLSPAQKRIHQAALRLFAETGSSDVNVSDLATAAGVSRGTIYNNVESTEHLFESVTEKLAEEMVQRIELSYTHITSPAERIAIGVRLFVRRAHAEPHWGRFLVHFAFSCDVLRTVMAGLPTQDVSQGMASGLFQLRPEQVGSVASMITGSVVSAMFLVLEGHRTWRDAGEELAELILRAVGLSAADAHSIARADLPLLAEIP